MYSLDTDEVNGQRILETGQRTYFVILPKSTCPEYSMSGFRDIAALSLSLSLCVCVCGCVCDS